MKSAIIAILISLLISCVSAPQIPEDLCSQYDKEDSVILRIAAIKGVPLNEIYYGLIDMGAMAIISKQIGKEKIEQWMNDVADWYIEHNPVSYITLIEYMTSTAEAQQLAGILSRRIGDFKSYLFISKYDDCLLRAGWDDAMDQLFLEKRV